MSPKTSLTLSFRISWTIASVSPGTMLIRTVLILGNRVDERAGSRFRAKHDAKGFKSRGRQLYGIVNAIDESVAVAGSGIDMRTEGMENIKSACPGSKGCCSSVDTFESSMNREQSAVL